MTKQEFLNALREALCGMPRADREERLAFYEEIIEDRMEEGLSEEQAVAERGEVRVIAEQIAAETPMFKLVREKITPRRKIKTWELVLLIAGFPVWLPLLMAVGAVVLSLYLSAWAVLISLWGCFGALAGAALGGLVCGGIYLFQMPLSGWFLLGSALVCGGLSVFFFYGSLWLTKQAVLWTKRGTVRLKTRLMRKEEGR